MKDKEKENNKAEEFDTQNIQELRNYEEGGKE